MHERHDEAHHEVRLSSICLLRGAKQFIGLYTAELQLHACSKTCFAPDKDQSGASSMEQPVLSNHSAVPLHFTWWKGQSHMSWWSVLLALTLLPAIVQEVLVCMRICKWHQSVIKTNKTPSDASIHSLLSHQLIQELVLSHHNQRPQKSPV